MFSLRWNLAAALLLAAGLSAAPPALAQRGDRPAEVRAVLRSVDSDKHTITVSLPGRGRGDAAEKTYTLSKDVEVLLDVRGSRFIVREGKLADLHPGVLVTLGMPGDGKTVESIIAEGPTLFATVKAIDAGKGTITLAQPPRSREEEAQEKTYAVSKTVEVGLDDGRGRRFSIKEGKLADVKAGSLVTVKLSLDQKSVESIVASGPTVFGVVKSVDAGAGTITLTQARGREEAEEKTFTLAKDADVVLGSAWGRGLARLGKLADVKAGSLANLRLSADQKTAVLVRAEGPSIYGQLKSVNAGKGTITVLVGAGRGSEGEEKTFTLGKKARIFQGGKAVKLADVKVGEETPVSLKLSLDQKTVESVQVSGGGRRERE